MGKFIIVIASGLTAAIASPSIADERPVTFPKSTARVVERQGHELAEYYPISAARAGVRGEVSAECAVAEDRRLSFCHIVAEYPKGWKFGIATAAALQQAAKAEPCPGDPPLKTGQVVVVGVRWSQGFVSNAAPAAVVGSRIPMRQEDDPYPH